MLVAVGVSLGLAFFAFVAAAFLYFKKGRSAQPVRPFPPPPPPPRTEARPTPPPRANTFETRVVVNGQEVTDPAAIDALIRSTFDDSFRSFEEIRTSFEHAMSQAFLTASQQGAQRQRPAEGTRVAPTQVAPPVSRPQPEEPPQTPPEPPTIWDHINDD
jgi:hypothetical protein